MIGRKSVIGIAVLCALAFSAFAAATASAEQRAYTCAKNVTEKTEQFSDAHCTVASTTGSTGFKHVLIEGETPITGTAAKTASGTTAAAVSKLKGALAGVETELECTSLTGTGQLTNAAASVSGTGVIVYGGCSVSKPAGKGCVVSGGTVTTEELAASTSFVGAAENKVQFKPGPKAKEEKFANIKIESCSVGALNNTFPVTGSLVATASGATLTTTHAAVTTENKLKFGGVKAGLEGSLTISMKEGDAITLTK